MLIFLSKEGLLILFCEINFCESQDLKNFLLMSIFGTFCGINFCEKCRNSQKISIVNIYIAIFYPDKRNRALSFGKYLIKKSYLKSAGTAKMLYPDTIELCYKSGKKITIYRTFVKNLVFSMKTKGFYIFCFQNMKNIDDD